MNSQLLLSFNKITSNLCNFVIHWNSMLSDKAPNVEVQRDSGSIIAGGSAGTTGSASLAGTEDEKDAARYRWLKTATKEQLLLWRGAWGCSDVAIDDAML
jgi:hypothetical protein